MRRRGQQGDGIRDARPTRARWPPSIQVVVRTTSEPDADKVDLAKLAADSPQRSTQLS